MGFWEDIMELLEQIVFGENLWRIAGAIGIIFLSLLFKQLFARFVMGMVRKLTSKTKTDIDDQLVDVFEAPARFAFIVLGIYLAGQTIDFSMDIQIFIGRITRSLILFTLFWTAYRAVNAFTALFQKIFEKTETKFDNMLLSFLNNGMKVTIIILGSITIAQVWFTEIAGILTGLGLGGLAFALAAQDTAANLFGSITIMVDRPFAIGDWIYTPHVEGFVEEMGFRSTRVRTFAQALVTIPNSVMSKDPITNWSRMGMRRIYYNLKVTYSTTPEKMRECLDRLREMLRNHPGVHSDSVYVYFENFGENSLEILMYFFTITTEWEKHLQVKEDTNLKIMEILRELGVKVALPSRAIYMETEK